MISIDFLKYLISLDLIDLGLKIRVSAVRIRPVPLSDKAL